MMLILLNLSDFYSRSDNLHWENHIEIDFIIANGKKNLTD